MDELVVSLFLTNETTIIQNISYADSTSGITRIPLSLAKATRFLMSS